MTGASGARGVAILEAHSRSTAQVAGVAIEVAWSQPAPSRLRLEYLLSGRWSEVRIPPPAAPRREDGLWRHTCFEAFVADPGTERYCEFNCSPAGAWAAYRFAGYREGRESLATLAQLPLSARTAEGRFVLEAELDLNCLPGDYGRPLLVALAAVLEHPRGELSYWALKHPGARADFHDRRGFELVIPG